MAFSSMDPPKAPGVIVVEQGVADFPDRLRTIPSAPKSLWVRGRLPRAEDRLIAVVGARAATRRACQVAYGIAGELSSHGASIVSGGALGVDAAAHEGALAANASTYAVLGCGVDIVYPDRHTQLFSLIASSGGLLSEYPPGTPPRARQFPARNRVIVGLADAVLVVEAALQSGALITARLARARNRPLFALPGSPGTDALLRGGHAFPARSAGDIERVLAGGEARLEPVAPCPLNSDAVKVVDALSRSAGPPAELCARLGMSIPALLAVLTELEMEGFVRRTAGNTYEVIGRVC